MCHSCWHRGVSQPEVKESRQGQRVRSLVGRLAETPLANIARKYVPKSIRWSVRQGLVRPGVGNLSFGDETVVDWHHTRAICGGDGLIYVNRAAFSNESDYEQFLVMLQKGLRSICHPVTGEAIAKTVYRGKEFYATPHETTPAIVIDANEGYELGRVDLLGEQLWDVHKAGGWVATHRRGGMFLLSGLGVRQGRAMNSYSILDLTPTLLYLFDCPIPTELRGRVLREILAPESPFSRHKPHYVTSSSADTTGASETCDPDDEAAFIKRLQDLGYI